MKLQYQNLTLTSCLGLWVYTPGYWSFATALFGNERALCMGLHALSPAKLVVCLADRSTTLSVKRLLSAFGIQPACLALVIRLDQRAHTSVKCVL